MQCPKCGSYNCQIITDYESNNRRRLMTGILYGFSFMSACIYGARRIYKKVGHYADIGIMPHMPIF